MRTPLAGLRGGPIERSGDEETARRLAHAFDVLGSDDTGELTHGFHSYPARFHPQLVRRLLAGHPGGLAPRARVLDPFVGSGTTLVEAALAGAAGLGVDLNPLAVVLARLKATPWPAARRTVLAAEAERVAERVTEEVRASRRRSARRESPKRADTRFDDPRWYPPHVYRELVALRLAIGEVEDEALRGALLLVLSAIVIKVSLQRSDTDERIVEKTIARGAPTRHFAAKAAELCLRMAAFAAAVPSDTPPPDVRQGDARHLALVGDASVDLVVTSPPYVGTYDYARHHLRRFGWLGLDPAPLLAGELGPRRAGGDAERALAHWRRDVNAYLGELGRVLRPGAWAYVLVGDSHVGGREVPGHEALGQAAGTAFEAVARVSQGRESTSRREHLVALRRR